MTVITITGAKSGRRYTTPVPYAPLDGDYVALSQRRRVWWRNAPADIELLSERVVPIVITPAG